MRIPSNPKLRIRSTKKILGKLFAYLILTAGALVMVAPFLWMITTSLKPERFVFSPPYLFPISFEWENYLTAFKAAPFQRFYLNTIVMAIGITVGQVFFSSLAAYAFARLRFPGRDFVFLIFLGTMLIPLHVTLIPSYLIIQKLNWINSYQALIVPRLVSAFGIFLMRQYYLSIPRDLDEAALIDGASRLTIWWKIILPLSGPALATLGIFAFLFAWNDFLWPLVVVNNPEMYTVQLGLAMFQGKYGTRWHLLMAGTVTATIPVIIAFLIGQNRFIEGITTTGLKG